MRCRSASDVWCVERPDGRWNINTLAGTKTSRRTQADAEAYCSAVRLDPSLLSKKKATGNAPPPRTSRHPVYVRPAAAKPRAAYGSLVVPPIKKAVDSFVAVIGHLEANPQKKKTKLGSLALAAAEDGQALQQDQQQLQQAFAKSKALLLCGLYDLSGVANSKAFEAVVGEGYSAVQERTFRRHRHCIMSKLREIGGDDTLRQLQILQGCLKTFGSGTKQPSAQDVAAQQVLEGIQNTLEKIKLLHGEGRTPHDLRVAQQTLQAASLSKVEHVHSKHIAEILGTSNRHQLLAAHNRGKAFLEDDLALPYAEKETSCNTINPTWAEKVASLWHSGTRPSENKKDELKNPKDRSDPKTYRVRFLERSLEQMAEWMNETGRREVDPSFSVSRFYIAGVKPFFVKRPGR